MKRNWTIGLAVALAGTTLSLGTAGQEPKFGDAKFLAYEGPQRWPTGESAQVIKDHSVPIYIGLPPKRYKVLGRIYDDRTTGIGVVGRELAHIFPEKDRQRDVASQAKYRGADAVVVTNDPKVLEALGLSKKEIGTTSPLKDHKDKVTLAVKFD